MTDKVRYWVELSDYDLDTAQAMLETRRYLYVGFMCHQVIEKILKAYWGKVLGRAAFEDSPSVKACRKASSDSGVLF